MCHKSKLWSVSDQSNYFVLMPHQAAGIAKFSATKFYFYMCSFFHSILHVQTKISFMPVYEWMFIPLSFLLISSIKNLIVKICTLSYSIFFHSHLPYRFLLPLLFFSYFYYIPTATRPEGAVVLHLFCGYQLKVCLSIWPKCAVTGLSIQDFYFLCEL